MINKEAITKQFSSHISKRLIEDKNYVSSYWVSSADAEIDTRFFVVDNLLTDDFDSILREEFSFIQPAKS
jgi:hypothetical protein